MRTLVESDTAHAVFEAKPFVPIVCCRRYLKHNLKTVKRLGANKLATRFVG
jgi:hypothetical protein